MFDVRTKQLIPNHPCMVYLPIHGSCVNVGKCTIHRLYGYGIVYLGKPHSRWEDSHHHRSILLQLRHLKITLPKTNSSPLKMVVSKAGMSFCRGLFSGANC